MENKLQELTQKLYDEGLSKGRAEGEAMLADARTRAKQIVDEANTEAARIRRTAEKEAADLHKNTLTELTLAGGQMSSELKSRIAEMVVEKSAKEPVSNALLDDRFIEQLLIAVAQNWKGSGADKVSLKAMLPADKEAELGQALRNSVSEAVGEGVEIEFSEGVKSGFRIAPSNGGYYIDFSDRSFYALLSEYLRPKVSEILFGKSGEEPGKTE